MAVIRSALLVAKSVVEACGRLPAVEITGFSRPDQHPPSADQPRSTEALEQPLHKPQMLLDPVVEGDFPSKADLCGPGGEINSEEADEARFIPKI
ncbi:unnamed protein product [Protopolystoma xenopodis]|uniref:Uncharacterized protein n=1 Tax=Protopolystoma xenopodis TaxID=117903 RepID=A0A3S4ZGD6_9PLAT|nr:unnamed protein product [Protopolystoma xenopodis]